MRTRAFGSLTLLACSGCGRIDFARRANDASGDGTTVPPSLVLYYAFETAPNPAVHDDSGNGLDAICMSSTNYPQLVPGHVGSAYHFDGSDDRFLRSDGGRLDLATGFSIALWLQPMATVSGSPISKPKLTGVGASWELALYPNDTWFCTVDTTTDEHCITTGFGLAPDSWTHIAMTWDTDIKRFYIQGVEVGSAHDVTTFDDQPLIVGFDREDGNFDNGYTGSMDELRVYSGALSAADVAGLANQ